jgi:hypothetical protein
MLLLPVVISSQGCVVLQKQEKPVVAEIELRQDECSIKFRYDGNQITAKEFENAYLFLYSRWAVVEFAEDWELPVLEKADFPKALSAEKDRLLKFNKTLYAVKLAAEATRVDKKKAILKDYKIGTSCQAFVGGDKYEKSRCESEIGTIFPWKERVAAFKKIVLSESEPYDCAPEPD